MINGVALIALFQLQPCRFTDDQLILDGFIAYGSFCNLMIK